MESLKIIRSITKNNNTVQIKMKLNKFHFDSVGSVNFDSVGSVNFDS
jgi:hypothetical protein